MSRRIMAALIGAAALASCGGGGNGGGGAVVTVPGGGGTTPAAPTPTPGPTTSPTPSPSPGYPRYAELTGDQQFRTACAGLMLNGAPPGPVPATAFGDGLPLAYAAAADTYGVLLDDRVLTFGPAQRDPAAPAGVSGYLRTENGFTQRFIVRRPSVNGVPLDYTRAFSLTTSGTSGPVTRSCIFGVPTRPTDALPAAPITYSQAAVTGTAYVYNPNGGGQRVYAVSGSTANVIADPGNATVTVRVQLFGVLQTPAGPSGGPVPLGTFAGEAPVDASRGSYATAFNSSDRISQFSFFGGWFFGPQGREAAAAFQVLAADPATGDRVSVLGTVTAIR